MNKLQFSKSIIDGVEIKRCRKTPHTFKMHLHKELQIGYIEVGSTCVTIGDSDYDLVTGDCLIIPPLMSHMCVPDDINHWQTINLYIDTKYYENAVQFNKAAKLNQNEIEQFKSFIHMLDVITDKLYLENLLIELLLEFGCSNENDQEKEYYSETLASKVQDYLVNNFKQDIQLNTLEEYFCVNKFSIIRSFKRKYNTTPRAYQLQLKVAEAKNLLADGRDIFDICHELRFYDQAHFIREFKKMHGITPLAYMEKVNRN